MSIVVHQDVRLDEVSTIKKLIEMNSTDSPQIPVNDTLIM
jgi:hypothetical protein